MFGPEAQRIVRRYWPAMSGAALKGVTGEPTPQQLLSAIRGMASAQQQFAEELATLLGANGTDLVHGDQPSGSLSLQGWRANAPTATLDTAAKDLAPLLRVCNFDSFFGPDTDGNYGAQNGLGLYSCGVACFVPGGENNPSRIKMEQDGDNRRHIAACFQGLLSRYQFDGNGNALTDVAWYRGADQNSNIDHDAYTSISMTLQNTPIGDVFDPSRIILSAGIYLIVGKLTCLRTANGGTDPGTSHVETQLLATSTVLDTGNVSTSSVISGDTGGNSNLTFGILDNSAGGGEQMDVQAKVIRPSGNTDTWSFEEKSCGMLMLKIA